MAAAPDLVVLATENVSNVGTYLMRVGPGDLPVDVEEAARHGVFVVRDGSNARCTTARAGSGALRFDPVAMIPLDDLARKLMRFFEEAMELATAHRWDKDDVLVIDNTLVVHGRASAHAAPDRELRRLMLRRTP